jgi:hypothetical protein
MKARWEDKSFREVLDMAIASEDDSDMYVLSGIATGIAIKEGDQGLYAERIWVAGHIDGPESPAILRKVLSEIRAELEGK